MICTTDMHAAIVAKAPSSELEKIVRATNPHSIRYDALLWLSSGVTSVDEVRRVGVC